MKNFKNAIHKKTFENGFGEVMTMVMTDKGSIWIHHEDCNEDFEKFDENFKYVLDKDEREALISFVDEAHNVYLT
jgi:hypothetical protein